MAATETIALFDALKEPIFSFLHEIKDEIKYFLDDGLLEYVDSTRNKYSKTKTFLFREERISFYEVYFPIAISRYGCCYDNFSDMNKLFSERKCVSIVGSAGSGKSMLLKHIFLSSINSVYRIPIIMELRNLNDFNGNVTDYIYRCLFKNKLAPNKKILERLLASGYFLFLFDGYDEIYSEKKNQITTDIEEFIDAYSSNNYVLTSRPGSNVEALQSFDSYRVMPLNDEQINRFVVTQLRVADNLDAENRILSVINSNRKSDYRAYLTSPLLLTMFIFTFNSYPELPRSKSRFYWNVFDTLCSRHDAFTKKGCWQHERKSKLQNDVLEKILQWFSFMSLFKGRYSFDERYLHDTISTIKQRLRIDADVNLIIYDLNVSISVLLIDGLDYTFPHKSLLEYFAASLIKDLPTTQKENIYTKMFDKLTKNTRGGNISFFHLCYELDKLSFLEFFVQRSLCDILNQIDTSGECDSVKSVIDLIGLSHGFGYDDVNDVILLDHLSRNATSPEILEYVIPDYLFLLLNVGKSVGSNHEFKKLISSGTAKEYNRNEKKATYVVDYSKNWNNDIVKFIKDIGLYNDILSIISRLRETYDKVLNEIKFEKENSQSILDDI